jgi:Flp pilus assembly protein TadD
MNKQSQVPRRTLTVAALTGLLLLTVAVYARGMNGDFEFDDIRTVQLNRNIHHLGNFLTTSSIAGAMHGWRALTEFTFALDYWATGLAPLSFHLTNLAIHLATTLLVFFFTRRILALGGATAGESLAVGVAAVFALHPLQTQAVIYISQCAELLASALYLGSILLLLRAERRGFSAAGVAIYVAAFVLFALGLGAKVIVATLPVAYLVIGILPGPRQPRPLARTLKRLGLAVPFLVYALATAVLSVAVAHGEDAGFDIPLLPSIRYFLTQWHVLVTYLRLLFWPTGQNLDWDFPLARGLGDPTVLLSGIFLLVLIAGAGILLIRCRSRADNAGAAGRAAAFGVAWFFVVLAPTSSVLPLADVLMEHRIYLASWGVIFATAILVGSLVQRFRPVLRVVALTCLCVGLASATFLRIGVWRSKLALWSDCVAKSPRKARVHLGLGNAFRQAGETFRAIDEFHTALDLAREDPRWIRLEIREKLAGALLSLGRADDAIAEVRGGLGERPNDGELLGLLAMAHLQRRDLPAAAAAAEASIRGARDLGASYRVLGMVRLAQGTAEAAMAALEKAVRIDPDGAQGRLLLAQVYRGQGRLREACDLLRGPVEESRPQVIEALKGCPEP